MSGKPAAELWRSGPIPVTAARVLFLVNALIWAVFGVVTLVRTSAGGENMVVTMVVIGVLMFGNAGAMLLAGLGLGMRRRIAWLFALAVLAVNIALTFTDQVGLLDIVTFAIDAVLVILLVLVRERYWLAKQ